MILIYEFCKIIFLGENKMRMWMVEPKLLCKKHLLGEHNEIHKHRHNFVKKHSVKGRIVELPFHKRFGFSVH